MKERILGVYIFPGPVEPDWERIATDMQAAGSTALSVFFSHQIGGGQWPYARKPDGGWDFTKINPLWRAIIRRMLTALKDHGIAIHACLIDQFHSKDDVDCARDPFREMFFGKDGEWDEEPVYSSVTMPPVKFWWLKWDEPHPGKYENYRVLPGAGGIFARYIKALIAEIKRSGVTCSWKWGNETLASAYRDEHGKWKTHNRRGDRDEVFLWVKHLWAASGYGTQPYVDYFCYTEGESHTKPNYEVMKDSFDSIRSKLDARMEIHGIMSPGDITKYKAAGLDPDEFLASTDGDRNMQALYHALGHSAFPLVDLKFDKWPGEMWNLTDFMKNWVHYWPRYQTFVK